jgi:hypothetical protein
LLFFNDVGHWDGRDERQPDSEKIVAGNDAGSYNKAGPRHPGRSPEHILLGAHIRMENGAVQGNHIRIAGAIAGIGSGKITDCYVLRFHGTVC